LTVFRGGLAKWRHSREKEQLLKTLEQSIQDSHHDMKLQRGDDGQDDLGKE